MLFPLYHHPRRFLRRRLRPHRLHRPLLLVETLEHSYLTVHSQQEHLV